jgi:hypothetical protein
MGLRVLVGIVVGAFLIAPILSGDVEIDLAQISATTQSVLEKAVLIVQLIASDSNSMTHGGNHAL